LLAGQSRLDPRGHLLGQRVRTFRSEVDVFGPLDFRQLRQRETVEVIGHNLNLLGFHFDLCAIVQLKP
jgi:hypothetical protein